MAVAVMLPYETKCGVQLTFKDLTNPRTVRSILSEFQKQESTNATSKGKYVHYFQELITFLLHDTYSPEKEN